MGDVHKKKDISSSNPRYRLSIEYDGELVSIKQWYETGLIGQIILYEEEFVELVKAFEEFKVGR